jgi:membrane-bound lytic murein transglycosylase B
MRPGSIAGRYASVAVLLGACLAPAQPSLAQDYAWDAAEVELRRNAFIASVSAKHDFDAAELATILATASIQQSALNAISRPAERVVPWFEYREIFLNEARIEAGARFWQLRQAEIEATAERFGLEPEMIVAILGIETMYGERMGSYRVVDALSTLAFAYPPRADFFASELESLLLIWSEEGPAVLDALGSYAGAMGAGQFIPSSYRAYAVDADGDGRRDLWSNWDDILASVANYFAEHDWRRGEPVAVPARQGTAPGMEPGNRLELDETVGSLRAAGYEFDPELPETAPAMLVAVERSATETEYWIGLHNFRVITRYNRSVKYALAALELSEAIRSRYELLQQEAG